MTLPRETGPDGTLARLEEALVELDRWDCELAAALADAAHRPESFAELRQALDRLDEQRTRAAIVVATLALMVHREQGGQGIRALAVPVGQSTAAHTACTIAEAADEPRLPEAAPIARGDDTVAGVAAATRAEGAATPLSVEEVARQLAAGRERRAEPAPPRPRRDVDVLQTLLHHLGRPSGRLGDDVERLSEAVGEGGWSRWDRMDAAGRQKWLAYLTAWARAVADDGQQRAMEPVFKLLGEYSKTRRPGQVNGLARRHTPTKGTWLSDARALADEIRPLRHSEDGWRSSGGGRDQPASDLEGSAGDEDERDLRDGAGPGDEWPFWAQVAGKRAVMFGGAPREERRAALQSAFRLASLEWVASERPRSLESLCERISQGGVDFVLLTRFSGHRDTRSLIDASRGGGALCVMVRLGYGVEQVRASLEGSLRPQPPRPTR